MGKIYSYTQALKAKLADLFVIDTVDSNVHSTKSVSVQQIGETVNGEQTFSGLQTTDKTVIGAINEVGSLPDTASGTIATFTTSLEKPLVACECELPYDANGYSNLKVGYCDFNQLLQNGNFTSVWTVQGGTANGVSDNVYDVSFDGTSGAQQTFVSLGYTPNATHKYFSTIDVKLPNTNVGVGLLGGKQTIVKNSIATTEWQTISAIWTGNTYSYYLLRNATSDKVIDHLLVRNAMFFDLTQMFGEKIANYIYDLERATAGAGIALFKAIFPKDYYGYTLGGSLVTIASVNSDNNPNASIDFGTTIYGGSLDITNGKLTDSYNADGTPKTPVVIDLTPTVMNTNNGNNTIVTTAQGNNSITYLETIKEYIDKRVNP